MARVAVVTGGNRGIGYAIVKGLCNSFNGDVYLTARHEQLGIAAVNSLSHEGISPKFHQLDICKPDSLNRFRDHLYSNYGGIDVLINNAGVFMFLMLKDQSMFWRTSKVTMQTNFWATLNVCNTLFPLLKSDARVVHMASLQGLTALYECGDEIQTTLKTANSIEQVENLMSGYVRSVRDTTHVTKGWPNSPYSVSKLGVMAITPLQQVQLDADTSRRNISVNACCPGFVNTAMNNYIGYKTVHEGAETPLNLALLPEEVTNIKGEFFTENQIWNWREENLCQKVKDTMTSYVKKAAMKMDN